MNILLIDDDHELTDLMRRFLEYEGFGVDCAADGISGLERMRNEAFDLAVIDVMMPGKNGMDVLRELRGFSPLARLTVALELARDSAGDAAQNDLARIGLEAERLNALIAEVLTLWSICLNPFSVPKTRGFAIAAVTASGWPLPAR